MSCKFVTQTCINCKYTDDYMVYFNDEPKDDFSAYKNYIDFDIQVCPNCGYIGLDIEKIAKPIFKTLQNQEEYKDILNYTYLDEYLEGIDTQILDSYPANLYEAYALLQEKTLEVDEAIRGYFRAVILKEAIVRRYQKERVEDADEMEEDEIQDYINLENALTESIKDNIIKILDLFKISSQGKFNKVIYIECLLRFFKVQDAQTVFNQMQNVDASLKEYILNLIEQRR